MVAPKIHSSGEDFTPGDPSNTACATFAPAKPPVSELAKYRLLAPAAGVRVSPFCLGAMGLGQQWTGAMGGNGPTPAESEEILDVYYEAGGNFIDTASNYQDEQSEHIVGDWMAKRQNRDEIVLATKYTTFALNKKEGVYEGIGINYGGNSRKAMMLNLEASLRRLKTTYIDLYYIHWWDWTTPIAEVMQSLNQLVTSGKVLYLGISDTPAWIVSKANEYARQNNLAQFVVYQGLWSLANRDMERDIIPMTRSEGMSIAPYGVLGQGKFKPPGELKAKADKWRLGKAPTENEVKSAAALLEVTEEIGNGVTQTTVALAWARQTVAHTIPIIGGSSKPQLLANIESLKVTLTRKQMERLTSAVPFDHGFPSGIFGVDPHYNDDGNPLFWGQKAAGHLQFTKPASY
ncbi:hypothetical protein P7C73_g5171, partial [Tremellales sp. Uapishka_1]